jgi:hypothetical protein
MRAMSVLTCLLLVACRVEDVRPATLSGILGPIRVEYPRDVVVDGDTAHAAWFPDQRLVLIDRDEGGFIPFLLAHERCHSAIADFGVTLPDSLEERVCDAMGALEARR